MIVDIIQKTKTSFFLHIYNIGKVTDLINKYKGIENEKLIYNNYLKVFIKFIKYLVGKRNNNLKNKYFKEKLKNIFLTYENKKLDRYLYKRLLEY